MNNETLTTKRCSTCNQDKDIVLFGKDKNRKDGLNCKCKPCKRLISVKSYAKYRDKIIKQQKEKYHADPEKFRRIQREHYAKDGVWAVRRNSYYKRTYGITEEDYNDMFIEQGGRCGICGVHQSKLKKRLVIDHCHKSEVIRGLLCSLCNTGIGAFDDNIEVMENAMKYLKLECEKNAE